MSMLINFKYVPQNQFRVEFGVLTNVAGCSSVVEGSTIENITNPNPKPNPNHNPKPNSH